MEDSISTQNENKMGIMNVNKLLLSMSIPMMISMMVQALYNVVDSIFVSRIGENALTAVSLAFPIQNLMISVVVGTGVGINTFVSKSLGERNFDNANKAANNGVLLAIISSLVFVVFGIIGSKTFFETQTNITEIISYGNEYLTIVCIISIFMFLQITFEKLLQSTGKTIYTLITQSTGAIINIILDPILIFGLFGLPKMGVKGAAIATVIGQMIAMLLAIYFNIKKNNEITLSFSNFKLDSKIVKKIYAVGLPSILMASIGSVMTYGMNRILIAFSSTATAVFGVYFKLQSFVLMPVIGLNNGIVPIIAYNVGARKKERIVKTIKLGTLYAMCITITGLVVIQFIPDKLLMMFNATDDMLSIGITALRIISLSFIFAGFNMVALSVFQALSHGVLSMEVSLIRQLVVLLPVAYLLSLTGSINIIWWSFPIAEIVSLIFSVIFMKGLYKREINNIKQNNYFR